jgi:hypothetical protein
MCKETVWDPKHNKISHLLSIICFIDAGDFIDQLVVQDYFKKVGARQERSPLLVSLASL